MEPGTISKAAQARNILSENMEMDYQKFVEVWKETCQTDPPTPFTFYTAKRKLRSMSQEPGSEEKKTFVSKASQVREILAENPNMTYRQFSVLWEKKHSSKVPHTSVFYTNRQRMKMSSVFKGETEIELEAHPVAPKNRPRGSRPVALNFNGTPDRRFKENREKDAPLSSKEEIYLDLELRLDQIIASIDKIRNHSLSEAIRHARRLVSKELLKG